ncbi:Replication factor C (RF-C) subunit [Serendipita sp. 401]|nr:Replication factor C (RF-C) subunit [Serendipita sp. 401]
MSLWVDKHRPRTLADLHYHKDLSTRLKSLAASGDFPHMLFYGPSGAGKKTRIAGTLRELFGPGTEKLKIDQRVFMTPSRRKLDLNIVQSNFHIEITPSDVGLYDRVVIQEILKEIAQTQQVDLSAKQRFKVVIINEADSLTRDAQAALRRTMEKYMANLRIILCSTSTSKLIAPIKSRCLLVRVGAPSDEEVVTVLQHVAAKERFKLPDEVASNLARDADGNTRKAVLMLEAMKMQQYVNPGIVLLRGNIRPQLIYIVMIMRSSSSCPYYGGKPPVRICQRHPYRSNQQSQTGRPIVIMWRT